MGGKTNFKSSYDVVVIGGGLHNLVTFCFLAKEHGINRRFQGFGLVGKHVFERTTFLFGLWACDNQFQGFFQFFVGKWSRCFAVISRGNGNYIWIYCWG